MTSVVFLTHNYPRYSGDVPGAFLATLARALVARGVGVRVVAPADAGETGAPTLDGIPVRRVRYAPAERETIAYRGTMAEVIRSPSGWRSLIALHSALRTAAREELAAGAALIHAHWWVPAGLASPPEAPLVLTVHGTDAALLGRSAVARLAARPVFRRARIVSAVSSFHAALVARGTGREIAPRFIQPMPVDPPQLPRSGGGAGLVVVARLMRQKRIHLALEALSVLQRRGSERPLTIIGDGPERPALERQAAALRLSDLVRFTGMLAPAEVAARLGDADLMLFPAYAEGFGLSAAEAFMAGVPVVACVDGGGVLDVVPAGGAGRWAAPSGEAIAQATLELLGEPAARERAWSLGQEWRTRLAPDTVATAYEAWYREAVGE